MSSSHSVRSKSKQAVKFVRETFDVGHVRFEIIDHPERGATFALTTKEGPTGRPLLFSGHIPIGMGTELRRLAHRIDEITDRMAR